MLLHARMSLNLLTDGTRFTHATKLNKVDNKYTKQTHATTLSHATKLTYTHVTKLTDGSKLSHATKRNNDKNKHLPNTFYYIHCHLTKLTHVINLTHVTKQTHATKLRHASKLRHSKETIAAPHTEPHTHKIIKDIANQTKTNNKNKLDQFFGGPSMHIAPRRKTPTANKQNKNTVRKHNNNMIKKVSWALTFV